MLKAASEPVKTGVCLTLEDPFSGSTTAIRGMWIRRSRKPRKPVQFAATGIAAKFATGVYGQI